MAEVTPAGVREDFKNLMHKFSSLRSFDFQEFSDTWNALKFYCLYWKAMEIRITHGELKEYDPMESFMKLCMMDAFHYVCCKDQVFAENKSFSTQVCYLNRKQNLQFFKHHRQAKTNNEQMKAGMQACAENFSNILLLLILNLSLNIFLSMGGNKQLAAEIGITTNSCCSYTL